jgi:heme/copper-type cytochrome/quinol oxidase subunit 2
MAMGLLIWEIAVMVVVTILVAVVVIGSSWFVREHDKRAEYYKKQAEICWRNK